MNHVMMIIKMMQIIIIHSGSFCRGAIDQEEAAACPAFQQQRTATLCGALSCQEDEKGEQVCKLFGCSNLT